MPNHLSAGIVSNDVAFTEYLLGKTVNGVLFHGLRARTTGAPANMNFGPGGDCRGAGIATKYGILDTWSHHREVVQDFGPIPDGFKIGNPS
mmetsp:Transcript_31593/g.48303  ORF Transcript_31593/g.48303 Transcript_31593/m.48303 type:complete len:91 (+) Transcript_31593:1355-1627(+)